MLARMHMTLRLAAATLACVALSWSFTARQSLPGAATEQAARPKITGVAHIALYAKDFEASRAFYRDFLGFAEPYSLQNADGSPGMTFFKVNERQYIELFPEREPGTDRLNHIAIETDDAEGMRRYLAARGVKVPEKVGKGRIGNSNFNIVDPEGHTVEIVQYEPGGWTVRENGRHLPPARVSHRIMHVGIIVTDYDAVMRFYTEVLGFTEIWRGGRDPNVLSWVNLKVPDGEDYIELMLHAAAPSPTARGTAHHLALEVPDIERSVAALEARKAAAGYARAIEIRTGVNRKRQSNFFDPDGTRTELMEPRTIDGVPAPPSTAPPPKRAGQ
jgi:lactoylglutathione lyase